MKLRKKSVWRDALLFTAIFCAAVLISTLLSRIHDDNNPFAVPVFILAAAMIARLTDGYGFGIAASVLGVICVNWLFTLPFGEFDLTISDYPLTFAAMLLVSILISALTTQIKRQEQVRLEAEREKMHANLLRAISHDIRTPLSSILGASSALESQTLPPEDQAALVREIGRQAKWLVRMTENLLSVTRFAGEAVALRKNDEVLEEIVGAAIVKYRESPGALPVHVSRPDDILLVPMDATLIQQVLINLFDNVNAHAKSAARIWLTIAPGPGRVTVRVEDDGEGIPPALLPKLFTEFVRARDDSRSDDRRSMGIGLSVCRSIIAAHGGGMRADNSPRGGALIEFTLPFDEEDGHAL